MPHLCTVNLKTETKMRHLSIAKKDEKETKPTPAPKRLNLLTAIEQIVERSANSGLSDDFFKEARRYISHVARKLSLTPMQAVLFSYFVDKSDDCRIRISEMASHFGCRMVRIIRYMGDLDELERRKLVVCRRDSREKTYRMTMSVIEALKENRCYEPLPYAGLTCDKLFDRLGDLFEQRDNNELTYEALVEEVKTLFEANKGLTFVQQMGTYDLMEWDWILLVFFCHLFVRDKDDRISEHDFEGLYDSKSTFHSQERELSQGDSDLMQAKLVEYTNEDGFADRTTFKLTDRAKTELLVELNITPKANPAKDLLPYTKLAAKTLYYNERESRQIEQLASLLSREHFDGIRARLAESGMRRGFACLFYGAPGTGKTETVLQLARRTGRDIMQVNFAELKSCWVGESEKNVKALFERYRALVETCEVTPILLFNEADAIISRRQEGVERAVDKMENSLQNIILQEMESLDGILIATTNLTQNMDKAFERRFLYKIEFGRPSLQARQAIWQTMLPGLDGEDARRLAEAYDFSGGQIENIARKQTVEHILSGRKTLDFDYICECCDNELIVHRTNFRPAIGFRA